MWTMYLSHPPASPPSEGHYVPPIGKIVPASPHLSGLWWSETQPRAWPSAWMSQDYGLDFNMEISPTASFVFSKWPEIIFWPTCQCVCHLFIKHCKHAVIDKNRKLLQITLRRRAVKIMMDTTVKVRWWKVDGGTSGSRQWVIISPSHLHITLHT